MTETNWQHLQDTPSTPNKFVDGDASNQAAYIGSVGIGTTDPKTTLDVAGDAATADKADGILTPRLTGDELRAKTAYNSDHTGALVYVTAADTATSRCYCKCDRSGLLFL